jgi:hypothetical protein
VARVDGIWIGARGIRLQIHYREVDRTRGRDHLDGVSLHGMKRGPQDLVACYHVVERGSQCAWVELPSQIHRPHDVVEWAPWLELIEQPEALLGGRKGIGVARLSTGNEGSRGGIGVCEGHHRWSGR